MRAANGIYLYGSSSNLIQRNRFHDNQGTGLQIQSSSNNNILLNNFSYNNGDHGIDITSAVTGTAVINNTVYKNVTSGINVEGGSINTRLANNITVDNAINNPRGVGNIRVDGQSTTGTTIDYDEVFLSQPGILVVWG